MFKHKKCSNCNSRLGSRKFYYLCKKCFREVDEMTKNMYKLEVEKLLLKPQKKILKDPIPTNVKPGPDKTYILEYRYKNGQYLWHPEDVKG